MSNPRSNSRRFVNAAWSLLTFQMIASVGAVAVTGLAAFHVRDLINGGHEAAQPVQEATAEPAQGTDLATPAPEAATSAPATDAAPASGAPPPPSPPPPSERVNDGHGVLTLTNNGEGTIISALSDPDGISQQPSFQWLRDGTIIQSATGSNYSFQSYDAGHTITARASYVDADGFSEMASQSIFIPLIVQ